MSNAKVHRKVSTKVSIWGDERLPVLALILLATVWYVIMSYWSDGLYGHDEIAHYLRAVTFWDDPASILGYWQRPGFKILYVVPALAGIKMVHFLTILFTVMTSVVAWLVARQMKLKNAYLTILFCAFQPLLVQLSFRMYAEVLAGLLLAAALLMYLKKNWQLCALLTGYLFTVRQEFGILGAALGLLLLRKRDYRSLALLAAGPIILALLGWIKSGNPLWIVQDFLPVSAYDVVKPGFWHYWERFAIIFGAPVTVFFLIGLCHPFVGGVDWRVSIRRYGILYVLFFSLFLVQCVLAAKFVISPSPGHLRYLVYLAPVVAIFANIGFNTVWEAPSGRRRIAYLVVPWVVLAWFTTYHHNYYDYSATRDVLSLTVFVIFGVVIVSAAITRVRTRLVLVLMTIFLFAHTFVTERPLAPDSEFAAVMKCAEWVKQNGLTDAPILTNHALFVYALGPSAVSEIKLPSLTVSAIDQAEPGTVIVWDSHYGSRPTHHTDVSGPVIQERADIRLLKFFAPGEFQIAVFQKIGAGP